MKSLDSERDNHPNIHTLNPLSETVKEQGRRRSKALTLVRFSPYKRDLLTSF